MKPQRAMLFKTSLGKISLKLISAVVAIMKLSAKLSAFVDDSTRGEGAKTGFPVVRDFSQDFESWGRFASLNANRKVQSLNRRDAKAAAL